MPSTLMSLLSPANCFRPSKHRSTANDGPTSSNAKGATEPTASPKATSVTPSFTVPGEKTSAVALSLPAQSTITPPSSKRTTMESPVDSKAPSPRSPRSPHPYTRTELPATATFSYEQTKVNRIYPDDLEPTGRFCIQQWPPLFLLGALQLPGTLAYILEHDDPHRYSNTDLNDCMLPATRLEDNVAGTLVLGRGRRNMESLEAWFGEGYVFESTRVEIELADGGRRKIWAKHWVEGPGNGTGEWTVEGHGSGSPSQGHVGLLGVAAGAAITEADIDICW